MAIELAVWKSKSQLLVFGAISLLLGAALDELVGLTLHLVRAVCRASLDAGGVIVVTGVKYRKVNVRVVRVV